MQVRPTRFREIKVADKGLQNWAVDDLEHFSVLSAVPVASISADPSVLLGLDEEVTHAVCISALESRDALENIHSSVHDRSHWPFNPFRVDDEPRLEVSRLSLQVRIGFVTFYEQFVGRLNEGILDEIFVFLQVKLSFLRQHVFHNEIHRFNFKPLRIALV